MWSFLPAFGPGFAPKKKRSKVGLFNRLSQCQFANGFSQEKEKKMFLAFGCETSQLLLSKQIIARNLKLVSKELNHLAAILHVYAGSLIFMK